MKATQSLKSDEAVPAPIDEALAWSLVRALHPGIMGSEVHGRVRYDPRPDVGLQVQANGTWTAAIEATDGARTILDLYLPLQLRSEIVIGQVGQSLDGRIATDSGDSRYVTGPADILRLHRLRSLVDAVVVGAGTVEADDPLLSVREVEGANPVRVVLDPEGRVGPDRKVFTDPGARTIVVRRALAGASAPSTPGDRVETLHLPVAGQEGFDPADVVAALRRRRLPRILVEGGGVTVSRFLHAGVLDRLHVAVAPVLLGSGRPAITLPPIETLDQALRPACRRFTLGDDVLFDLDLRSDGPTL